MQFSPTHPPEAMTPGSSSAEPASGSEPYDGTFETVAESRDVARIAVILPVYNTARYLPECLDSLSRQTHGNFVVYAVDDGSADNSAAILEAHAERDARFHVFRKANGGVSSARNLALEAVEADGRFDIIAFCDSDDVLDPNFLALCAKGHAEFRASCITVGFEAFNKTGPVRMKAPNMHPPIVLEGDALCDFMYGLGAFKDLDSPATAVFICTTAYDASAVRGLRFDASMPIGEDQDYRLHAIERCRRGVAFSDMVYRYRIRRSSLSHDVHFKTTDLDLYLNWLGRSEDLSPVVRRAIESRAASNWMHCLRWAYEDGKLDEYWSYFEKALAVMQREFRYESLKSFSMRKRILFFRLGRAIMKLYLSRSTDKTRRHRKLENAYD